MTERTRHCCEQLDDAVAEDSILYVAKFREWGIPIPDGGTSFLELSFCPFCGAHLPPSLRDEWFDRAESLGIGPPYDSMPNEYQSDLWWLHPAAPDRSR